MSCLESLRPAAASGVEVFWQDDGGGDDRAKERTAADLVHARDGAEAVESQGLFVRAGADQKLEHALLGAGHGDGLRMAKSGSAGDS